MSEACRTIHNFLLTLPRFKAGFAPDSIPKNGLYFLFETGELGHGLSRIVRVGTHRGQNNLAKRLREHLYTPNKDRSIFRKHVGRCLLARSRDPFLTQWDIDLTTKKAREKHGGQIDRQRLELAETQVSDYMNENFSFVVLEVAERASRLAIEEATLSTIATCTECGPSEYWLGLHHPKDVIKRSGLWNVQGLDGPSFDNADVEKIFKI